MSKFDEAIDFIVGELMPRAEAMSKEKDRGVVPCLVTILRPYLAAYVTPAAKAAKLDNRTRKWNVRLTFAATDGAFSEIISKSEVEIVQGFDEVIEMVLDYTAQTHEHNGVDIRELPSMSMTNLKKRFGGMRPAISKGGGYAHTLLNYVVNEHYYVCKVEISRENIPLDNEVSMTQ